MLGCVSMGGQIRMHHLSMMGLAGNATKRGQVLFLR